jgi:hypothetical protein
LSGNPTYQDLTELIGHYTYFKRAVPENAPLDYLWESISLLGYPKLFWAGFLMYAASFFLVAVSEGSLFGDINARGAVCAWAMLIGPFSDAKALLHPSIFTLVNYFSGVISGLINPIFLVAVVRRSVVLRNVVLLMVPFCWIVFYHVRLYPREGYILWIIGMLLVLFSVRIERSKEVSVMHNS